MGWRVCLGVQIWTDSGDYLIVVIIVISLLEVIVLVLESLPWCSNMAQTLFTNSCYYCNIFTRGDSIGAGESALVFKHGPDFVY